MATVTSPGHTAVDDFVDKLAARMKTLGISPRGLAEMAGVGFPYLYRVLKGEQTPSLEWAAKVGGCVDLEIRTVRTRKSA